MLAAPADGARVLCGDTLLGEVPKIWGSHALGPGCRTDRVLRRAAHIRGEHRSESNDEEEICCELFHKSFCTCRDDPQIWNFEFATHKSLSKVISTLVSLVRCMRITRTLKAVCCMLYAGCCTLYAVRCILYTVWYMLYAVCFMLYDVCCVVYAVYCIFDVVRRLYAVCYLLYHVIQRFVL